MRSSDGAVGLRVDLAGLVRALELPEPEHLGVATHERTVHRLDLETGVLEGGLHVRLVEPLGVRHLMVHAGVE